MSCNNYEKAKKKIEQDSKKRELLGYCCPSIITGPTGPQGENGRDGVSDTITIRSTTTGEAGNNAQVIDVTGSPNHILDFIIPRGFDGEIGPTGPTGSISSNCYGMAHSTINQTLNNNDYVPFNVSDRVSNIMIAQNGIITLSLEGTYLINWWITVNPIDTTLGIINFE